MVNVASSQVCCLAAQSLRGACDVNGTGRLTVAGRLTGVAWGLSVGRVTLTSIGTVWMWVYAGVGDEVNKARPKPAPTAKPAITPSPIIHLINRMIST